MSLARPPVCAVERAAAAARAAALTPPLAALSLASADVGMPPKRKASDSASASSGHWGLTNDSSSAVALVALSRLYRSKDEGTLAAAARTPFGLALLSALRSLVLRIAVAHGGADRALTESNVVTLFNLGASHVAQQRLYAGGLSLPGRLPWRNAKRLLVALYDSLAAARHMETGLNAANLLMQPGTDPASVDAQAAIQALVAAVELAMVARLGEGGSGGVGGSSSSSSASSTPVPQPQQPQQPQQPPSLPLPQPPPPLVPVPAPVQPQQPFSIDASQSLLANIRALLGSRLGRPLTPPELASLESALEQALGILQAGGAAAQRQLLATGILAAMLDPGAAQLWASTLEAAESGSTDVAAIAQAIVDSCSAVSAALFSAVLTGI